MSEVVEKMNTYKIKTTGVMDYGEEKGTAGVELEYVCYAPTHEEAKTAFKGWLSEQVESKKALSFDGTVSAWLISENQILEDAPFKVSVTLTKSIEVDF